jgi:hypothetical protein
MKKVSFSLRRVHHLCTIKVDNAEFVSQFVATSPSALLTCHSVLGQCTIYFQLGVCIYLGSRCRGRGSAPIFNKNIWDLVQRQVKSTGVSTLPLSVVRFLS